ncbi:MAG: hemolysin family protein, partial [Comamonas sp.]
MTLTQSLLIIALLIAASAFVAVAEISLAASRRLRLRQMADEGDPRAEKAIQMQEQPGDYFTVVQVGQNAISILGGIVGSSTITGSLSGLLEWWLPATMAQSIASVLSFLFITSLFILFADLLPRRLSMVEPEYLLIRVLRPMQLLTKVFKPVVWFYGRITDAVIHMLGLPDKRDESITSDDILAMTEDGARAGVLAEREQQAIANIFELDTRTVASAMTQRDRIAYFLRDDPDSVIRARIAEEPFSTYPVCEGDIDHIVGYVDAKDLFQRVLNNQPISLKDDSLIRKILLVPDKLTLAEVLDQFQQAHEDFAIILN